MSEDATDTDRTAAEGRGLELGELEYRQLVDAVADAIFIAAGEVLEWVSPAFTALAGWTPEDLVGGPASALWHAGDRAVAGAVLERALAGQTARGTFRLRTRDGRDVWVEASLRPYSSADGRAGAVGMLRDVGDRVAAEEALAASEEQYRLVAENASDVVVSTDVDGVVRWATPSVSVLTGREPEDLVGRPYAEVIHPDDLARYHVIRASADDAGPLTYLVRVRKTGGAYQWVSVAERPARDRAGRVVGRVASWRDIQHEVEAREALADSEARYRSLSDSSLDLIFVVDRDLCVRYVNPAAAAALRRDRGGALAVPLAALFPEETAARMGAGLAEVFATGRPRQNEARMETPGGVMWLDTWLAPIGSAGGQVKEVLGISRDVTEAKRGELELRLARDRLELSLQAGGAGTWELDVATDAFTWSDRMYELFGLDPEADRPTMATWARSLHPDDVATAEIDFMKALADHAPVRAEYRIVRPDGEVRWITSLGRGVYDDEDRPLRMIGLAVDTTERRLAEEQYRLLAENASDVVFRGGEDGRFRWVSPSVAAILGWSPEELTGTDFFELVHLDDVARLLAGRERLRTGEPLHQEVRLRTARGDHRWFAVTVRDVPDQSGGFARVGSWRDIQAEVEARTKLAESEDMFKYVFEYSVMGMALVSPDGRMLSVNAALCGMLGTARDEVEGHHFKEFLPPQDALATDRQADDILAGTSETANVRVRLLARDGSIRWAVLSAALRRADGGEPLYFLASIMDVTDQVEAEQELERRATHDELTGLANREAAFERMAALVGHEPRTGQETAVMFCDVDHFKAVNDERGHAAGDEVLRVLALRVLDCVREDDLVARIGGDELLVMLDGVHDIADAVAVAENIRAATGRPVPVPGPLGPVSVTLSIGVTTVSRCEVVDAFLARADQAMYQAKLTGRDRVVAIAVEC